MKRIQPKAILKESDKTSNPDKADIHQSSDVLQAKFCNRQFIAYPNDPEKLLYG
ncbi:MAG: hypothetical protein LBG96_12700 [Tannerella sp.]|nr:hypothetical protein [Tannerella sp.]